jgi:hypothetical protein
VAILATLHVLDTVNSMLDEIGPAIWEFRQEQSLGMFKRTVEKSIKDDPQPERRDMGKFNPGSRVAIISAPGAVPRSFQVALRADPDQKGLLMLPPGVKPPLLNDHKRYDIDFRETSDMTFAYGSQLQFKGISEYDFMYNAVAKAQCTDAWVASGMAQDLFSFTCVWEADPNGSNGHCTDVSKVAQRAARSPSIAPGSCCGYRLQHAKWLCEQLAVGYAEEKLQPECGGCMWLVSWAQNVERCAADGQELRFAFLELPGYKAQPQFECTAEGCEGMYFVGIAQKIELEWAQDKMGLVVKPMTRQDVIAVEIARLAQRSFAETAAAMDEGDANTAYVVSLAAGAVHTVCSTVYYTATDTAYGLEEDTHQAHPSPYLSLHASYLSSHLAAVNWQPSGLAGLEEVEEGLEEDGRKVVLQMAASRAEQRDRLENRLSAKVEEERRRLEREEAARLQRAREEAEKRDGTYSITIHHTLSSTHHACYSLTLYSQHHTPYFKVQERVTSCAAYHRHLVRWRPWGTVGQGRETTNCTAHTASPLCRSCLIWWW